MAAVLIFLCMAGTGCGEDKAAYFDSPESGTEWLAAEGDDAASRTTASGMREETAQEETAGAQEDICYVYVCGAVHEPGVYELAPDDRIYRAVEAAGGLTEEADSSSINQAEKISDGQMIRILTKEEARLSGERAGSAGVENTDAGQTGTETDGRININLASAEELMTLPGIGKAKADSMIAYREKSGGFSSIEEIMQVEGIKEGVYNRIKDNIKVK